MWYCESIPFCTKTTFNYCQETVRSIHCFLNVINRLKPNRVPIEQVFSIFSKRLMDEIWILLETGNVSCSQKMMLNKQINSSSIFGVNLWRSELYLQLLVISDGHRWKLDQTCSFHCPHQCYRLVMATDTHTGTTGGR